MLQQQVRHSSRLTIKDMAECNVKENTITAKFLYVMENLQGKRQLP
jgi:hypothetical protein